ncbi:MAG: hypothetical protein AAGF12_38705 [Myxococcota bacterium]
MEAPTTPPEEPAPAKAPEGTTILASPDPASHERVDRWMDEAARSAEEQRVALGQTVCEAALQSLSLLNLPDLPPAEQFLPRCRSLPAAAQQCLVVSYSLSHGEECRTVRESLSPEELRVLTTIAETG